jgi:DNA (cytosine-5)-methyltransferase 1
LIKILELFGGIGAPRKALENLNVDLKSVDYVEILPYAVSAYNQLFDNGYKPQDVKTWNRNVDLLVHGSPCQDWSKNGLNDVSTGRSILYERTLEIIEKELNPRPKVVIWENVTGLISKRHITHFNHYLTTMEWLGYKNTFKILNAKDYGTPQNRERIFTVSILGDYEFSFPEPVNLTKTLADYIDFSVDPDEYALTENELSLFFKRDGKLFIRENTKAGCREVNEFDSINVERPNSTTRRGRIQRGMVPTLTTSPNVAVYYNGILRKISPRECWRLLGFTDADYDRVAATNIPKTALYKLPGNSIVVTVLEAIFDVLLKDIKVGVM